MAIGKAPMKAFVIVFFGATLLVGMVCFDDFGISWDEPAQRSIGQSFFDYILGRESSILADRHRYYGPVFEIFLFSLEKILGIEDPRRVFLMRHLVGFLLFWIGLVFLFLIAKKISGRSWMGLLCCSMLVLTPSVFSHAFFNSKDIPFMVFLIIGIYTLIRLIEKETLARVIAHGFVSALIVDTRIVGLMIILITFGSLLLKRFQNLLDMAARRSSLLGALKVMAVYLITTACLVVLMWPTLWHNPLKELISAFKVMSEFPWQATVLYMGKEIFAGNLPWHYLPVWMAISIPISVLSLGVSGMAIWLAEVFNRAGPRVDLNRAIIMMWFFIPLVYLMFSQSVLYDAWRHAFFIYPGFVLASTASLDGLVRMQRGWMVGRVLAWIAISLVLVDLGTVGVFMLRNHPHQYVYFNRLVGGVKGAKGGFEMDYWGISYRKLLEQILEKDQRPIIQINAATAPGRYNALILPEDKRNRLVFISQRKQADYYITNFRWVREKPRGDPLYAVKVDGVVIGAVYAEKSSEENRFDQP